MKAVNTEPISGCYQTRTPSNTRQELHPQLQQVRKLRLKETWNLPKTQPPQDHTFFYCLKGMWQVCIQTFSLSKELKVPRTERERERERERFVPDLLWAEAPHWFQSNVHSSHWTLPLLSHGSERGVGWGMEFWLTISRARTLSSL